MSGVLRATIDPAEVSLASAIVAAAWSGPLVILSDRAFRDLCRELGGLDQATRYLELVAEDAQAPIGVHVEAGAGTSSTTFLAPRSWTQERLRGWIAGHHAAIESVFGPATVAAISARR